jgi:hypothetical protein
MAMKPRVPTKAIPNDFAANMATKAPAEIEATATVAVTSLVNSFWPASKPHIRQQVIKY